MDFESKITEPQEETPAEPILFENVHTRNAQTYRELYRRILFGGGANISALSVIALAAVFICVLIVFEIGAAREVPLWHWCAAAFALIYIPLFKIFPYRYYVKYAVARDASILEGEEPRLMLSVTERAILIDAPRGEHVELHYDEIKRADETKHYILLQTHAKVIYTVAKDGFTGGSYTDFCAFLRTKGIKINNRRIKK